MRAVASCPNLRAEVVFRRIRGCLAHAARGGLRVVHFSVQRNHIHLVVEAADRVRLSRGVQGLASAIARVVNRTTGRRASLWRDRYHRRDLSTPSQVRNAIVYVLMNIRKHHAYSVDDLTTLDSRSSAAWFAGWHARARPALDVLQGDALVAEVHSSTLPVRPPTTWLGATGWKRRGLVHADERPALPG